jgi:hypothetical protein
LGLLLISLANNAYKTLKQGIRLTSPFHKLPIVLLATLGMFNSIGAATAQDIDTRELGAGYAQLLGFASEPEISASIIDVESSDPDTEDMEFKGTRLPLHREFDIDDSNWRWFAQGSLGYLKLDENQVFDQLQEDKIYFDAEWQAYTGMVEAGLIIPLGAGFSLAPSVSAGLSRLKSKMTISDPFFEDILNTVYDGSLYNWSTNATIGRAHLALLYDRYHGSFRFKGGAHLSYAYVSSYNESSKFAGFADDSGTAIVKMDVSRRINDASAKHRIYLIGHIANTTFLGDNRQQLDFDYFNELGLSLGIDNYAMGVMAVFGDDVSGVSLTFNYNY